MLQIDIVTMASDALEDAMRLAQVKALNSFTFSDCLNYLNYTWSDLYNRMATIDDGYFGVNVRLTQKLTKLPAFVKNTVQVYRAQSPRDHNRKVYVEATATDIVASNTYKISGNDLYCADAEHSTIWLYFVPACPQLFFTHHNRDPILHDDDYVVRRNDRYNLFRLRGWYEEDNKKVYVNIATLGKAAEYIPATREELMKVTHWEMWHLSTEHSANPQIEDITDKLVIEQEDEIDGFWKLCYISCDYPYIFVSYEHSITNEHISGFFTRDMDFNRYNPFDFTGRKSNVEYIDCKWNDKTGMGVIIKDYNDYEKIKELGWTPDSILKYPKPEMYRYLVARLADKFAALNESDIIGVQRELVEARYAFEAFFDVDKSAWKKITKVTPIHMGDYL